MNAKHYPLPMEPEPRLQEPSTLEPSTLESGRPSPFLHPRPAKPARSRSAVSLLVPLLWLLAIVAVPVRNHFEKPAWDVAIYLNAVHSVHLGHDPYADAIAIQQQFHRDLALHPTAQVPFSYVYSPVTLPILRLVGTFPLWISGVIYGLFYLGGLLAQIWGGLQATEPSERRFFLYFAPVVAFFPGLLASDIFWSGNVAFILYGLVMLTAVIGWRRGQWGWFYVAVVAGSCVKAPLLGVLLIPALSARRQWVPAGIAAAAGLGIFALQPLLWPSLFRNYLEAVELQFSYNRDFGCSPAGLFSGYLFDHHLPYSPAGYVLFVAYALPLFALLVYLSHLYFRGRFSLQQWIPVLLVGVVLLNPRILEYDEIMLTLPLALIVWRFFAAIAPSRRRAVLLASSVFLLANVIAYQNWRVWKLTEGPLLVFFFAAGAWTLLRLNSKLAHSPLKAEQKPSLHVTALSS